MQFLAKRLGTLFGGSRRPVSICAIVAVRNELPYLRVLLGSLATQGVDVVVLDNESTDGSHDVYDAFRGRPIVAVETIPYHGAFSLSDQLEAKQRVSDGLTHDWVIHLDADEILEHRDEARTLRDAIQAADDDGYNALDFEEFVFLPEPGADYRDRDYVREMSRYYHFRPSTCRLNRAWKRGAGLSNLASGGHRLEGKRLAIDPRVHVARHYIALSEGHLHEKYVGRAFAPEEVARGWHLKRLELTEADLRLPTNDARVFTLRPGGSKAFCRDAPASTHFWQW